MAEQAQTDIVARRTVVPRNASCGASGLEGTTGSQTAEIATRATGEPQERRCEALARRGRRERASECAKRGALEV
jgi:hypothetical protein